MLMANSIEGRFPFLDHRLAEFAAALPPHVLMRGLNEKHLLKRALGAELPAGIVARKKQPYRTFGGSAFLTGAAREETRDVLARSALVRSGYFDPEKVERLLLKLERGGGPVGEKDNMAFLGILSTQRLHDAFVRDYSDWALDSGH
jgi:asparagine synthase (glutamine-hydrolysing)